MKPKKLKKIPTRGVDHIGFTVPNIDEAVCFFSNVLGCEEVLRFGPFQDDKENSMVDFFDLEPRTIIKTIVMMRCGNGSNIELLEYNSPSQKENWPKNYDYGGFHVAFYVDDIQEAIENAKKMGLNILNGPLNVEEGPAAGFSVNYLLTPWGMSLELISYPKGVDYEKNTRKRLWKPEVK